MTLSVRSVKRSLLVTVIAVGVCAPPAGAATLGGLTQLGGTSSCVTGNGSSGVCTAAPEMNEANSLLISPDGRFAYVNGWRSGEYSILIFSRDTATGALSPLSGKDFCLTENGGGSGGAGACTDARLVGYSNEGDSLAMTKDGSFLYVGGWSTNGVAAFKRDAATGKLTQLAGTDGCVSQTGSSEEGADTCADGRVLEPRALDHPEPGRAVRLRHVEGVRPGRRLHARRRRDLRARRDDRQAHATRRAPTAARHSTARARTAPPPARTCAAAGTRTRSRSPPTASTPTCPTSTRTPSRSSISTPRRGRSRSPRAPPAASPRTARARTAPPRARTPVSSTERGTWPSHPTARRSSCSTTASAPTTWRPRSRASASIPRPEP